MIAFEGDAAAFLKQARSLISAVCSITAVASLFLCLFLRDQVRGDLVVQTLIHLRDFSVYFWGQDRYFSLIPLLLAWNRDAELGLYLTSLCNALSFFTVPYLLLIAQDLAQNKDQRQASDSPGLRRFIVLIIFAAIICIVWSQEELYFFVKDASPFPLATALGFLSVLSWCSVWPATNSRVNSGKGRWIVSGLLILLSLLVAPTTVGLSTAYLIVVAASKEIREGRTPKALHLIKDAVPYLATSLIAYFAIQAGDYLLRIPKLATYSEASGQGLLASAALSIQAIWSERSSYGEYSGLRVCLFLLIPLLGLCTCGYNIKIASRKRGPILINTLAVFWVYAGVCLVIFSSLKWVAQNGYHFRYQYPLYTAWTASTIFSINFIYIRIAQSVRAGSTIALKRAAIPAVIMMISLAVTLRPTLSEASSVRDTLEAYQWMETEKIKIIAGDYWASWPLYLWSHRRGTTWPLESVAHRSSSNFGSHDWVRAETSKQLESKSSISIACIGAGNQSSCTSQYMEVIQRDLPVRFTIEKNASTPKGVSRIICFK